MKKCLAFIFRKEKQPIPKQDCKTKVTDYVPAVLLLSLLGILIGLVYNSVKYKTKESVLGPVEAIVASFFGKYTLDKKLSFVVKY